MQSTIPNPTHTIGRVNATEKQLAQRFARDHAHEQRKAHALAYREQVTRWADNIARTYIARSPVDGAHLSAEFSAEAQSALGEALALRIYRFPKLARDLLARFACGALSSATRKALRRCALRACDARLRRLKHDRPLESAHLDVFWSASPQPEGSAAADSQARDSREFVHTRIDCLLALVRARVTNGNQARAAAVHCKLLEEARAVLLASIAGESIRPPAAGLIRCEEDQRLAKSALYFRLYRLARFLGPDGDGIAGALRYTARR